jgi:hypothetical protein
MAQKENLIRNFYKDTFYDEETKICIMAEAIHIVAVVCKKYPVDKENIFVFEYLAFKNFSLKPHLLLNTLAN